MLLLLTGLFISIYGTYIIHRKHMDASYTALCDINDSIACSTVLTSRAGQMFGLSNALLGVVFYSLMLFIWYMDQQQFMLYPALASVIASLYLARKLIIMKKICLVCIGIYTVNVLVLINLL